MGIDDRISNMQTLKRILGNMDVPPLRKIDLKWLEQNLAYKNRNHIDYERAMELIKILLTN